MAAIILRLTSLSCLIRNPKFFNRLVNVTRVCEFDGEEFVRVRIVFQRECFPVLANRSVRILYELGLRCAC